jgi:hypothetical protein
MKITPWNFSDSRRAELSLDDFLTAKLEAALDAQYSEQYENRVFQYQWALRHPVVKEAISRALANRYPSR